MEPAQQAWYAAAQAFHEPGRCDPDTHKFALLRVEAAREVYHDMTRDLANTVRRLIEQTERDATG
ncbi:hypothetical protein [Pseudomonas zeae]|uniref:hypothetical protein n=1 Tax=Pseudomonas zeae TaxID=2745510 RepID=UPI0039E131DF